ncbi:RHS repeat domain-containing protein, partial [Tahibacter harae]
GTPRVYTYDARDRMKALSLGNGTTLHFTYHADGLRREKTDDSTTTRYQYDGQSLLAETNTIGNTLKHYHYSAEQLLAETKAGTTPQRRQYLLDALRSPIALLTAEGVISARTSYDAFGEVRAQLGTTGALITPNREAANAELPNTDGQAIGFTGYLKDTESGLYYAKARYYDPATARFNTEDPEAGKDLEPPSLHRYLYAYANPTVYVDPTGRCANNWCGAGMAYGFAKTDEERAQAAHLWVNSDPVVAGFAAAAVKTYNLGSNTAGWLIDAGSDDPDAQARQAARIAGVTGALAVLGTQLKHHAMKGQGNNLVGAMAADALIGLGQRTGENASEANLSLEKRDYFGAWMAGADLIGNVAEIATLSSAIAKPTAFLATEARNGRAVRNAAEAKRAEALLERKMQMNPDNDFRDDKVAPPVWPQTGGSGPVPGTIGITNNSPVTAFLNYRPRGGGVEYVYDPTTEIFVAGRVKNGIYSQGSPHEQLANSIGAANKKTTVGGTMQRGPEGEIFTTENSGHYGINWNNEISEKFVNWLSERTGKPVKHEQWIKN